MGPRVDLQQFGAVTWSRRKRAVARRLWTRRRLGGRSGCAASWGSVILQTSVERAFAVLGLSSTCRLRDLRHRYKALAREWHPDHSSGTPESRKEATVRMAEINDAYRVARQHLRRMRVARTPPVSPGEAAPMRRYEPNSTNLWQSWRHAPWLRPSQFERYTRVMPRLIAMVVFVAAIGEIARRALPTPWELRVSLATAAVVGGGSLFLFLKNRA